MMTRWIAFTAGVAVLMLTAASAWACPTCSEAIKDDPAAVAFYWSTLFMIAMPYSIALTVGGGLIYVYRRAARSAPTPLETDGLSWPIEGPEKEGGR